MRAFPYQFFNNNGIVRYNQMGMSLRDYFAAKAMQSLVLDRKNINFTEGNKSEWIAEMAYEYADAMIKARDTDEQV